MEVGAGKDQRVLDGRPAKFVIKAVPDEAPRVRVEKPGTDLDVTPEWVGVVKAEARDDFGVASANIKYELSSKQGEELIKLDSENFGTRVAGLEHTWDLAELKLQPGTAVSYRLEARDFRDDPGPNVGASDVFHLRVISKDQMAVQFANDKSAIKGELLRIIKREEEDKTQVDALKALAKFEAAARTRAATAETEQRGIARATGDLRAKVEKVLERMAANRMANAEEDTRLGSMAMVLGEMEKQKMPEAAETIRAGRSAEKDDLRQAGLAKASGQQQQILDELNALLEKVRKWEETEELLRLARELLKKQEGISKDTADFAKSGKLSGVKSIADLSDPAKDPVKKDVLAIERQQREAGSDMGVLEQKMTDAFVKLKSIDAFNAQKVGEALQIAQDVDALKGENAPPAPAADRQGVRDVMETAAAAVGKIQMGRAAGEQARSEEALKRIIASLARRKEADFKKLMNELTQAEQKIKDLIKREQDHIKKTEDAIRGDLSKQIAEMQKNLEKLLKEQQDLHEATKKLGESGELEKLKSDLAQAEKDLDQLIERETKAQAGTEAQLSDAEKLVAGALAELARLETEQQKLSADTRAVGDNPQDVQDLKPRQGQLAKDAAALGQKLSEAAKQAQGGDQAAGGKESAGKLGQAAGSTGKAGDSMGKASADMNKGDGPKAQPNQNQAAKNLADARKALEDLAAQLAGKRGPMDQAAKDQGGIKKDTDDLAGKMGDLGKKVDQQTGTQGSMGQAGQAMQGASGQMGKAGQQLQKGSGAAAAGSQSQAAKDLAAAKAALQAAKDALAQGNPYAKTAEKQGGLSKEAQALAQKLGEMGKQLDSAKGAQGNVGKAGENMQGAKQSLGGEGKGGEGKGGEGKGGEGKGGEGKGGEGKGGEGKGGDGNGGEGKGGDGKGGQQGGQQANKQQAQQQQQQAMDNLKKALDDMKKVADEASKKELKPDQKKDQLAEIAKQQGLTREETEKLKKMLEELAKKSGMPQPQKAADHAQNSKKSQQSAEGQLGQGKPQDAKDEEEDAKDELEKAQAAVQDAKKDAQDKQQEEELFKIEKELKELLAMQTAVNEVTREVERGRQGNAKNELNRPQEIKVVDATKDETLILARTRATVKRLADSPVFAWVLDDTAGDVQEVRNKLEKKETGVYTQEVEKDVVRKFEELIDALKKERDRRDKDKKKGGGGGGGGGGGKQPLVPPLAELKMIRKMQGDVNEKTKSVDEAVSKAASKKLTEEWKALLERAAQKQGDVAKVTKDLADLLEKQQQQAPPQDDPKGGK